MAGSSTVIVFVRRCRSSLAAAKTRPKTEKFIEKNQPKMKYQDEKVPKSKINKIQHILKNLYPWKTKAEFIQHLANNVIYNSGKLFS